MFKKLYPSEYLGSIYEIDYYGLRRRGVKALVFDLDNTIAPYDVPEPDERILLFFGNLRAMGFDCCLLSNGSGGRVRLFNEKLGLLAVCKAGKPSIRGLKEALRLMGVTTSEAVMIGDQIFTDILCGNRAGVHAILVKPISGRDELSVRLKRPFEKPVMRSYLRYVRKKGL